MNGKQIPSSLWSNLDVTLTDIFIITVNSWTHFAPSQTKICHQAHAEFLKMMRWWNTKKHKLAGEKFMKLTFYWLSVSSLGTVMILANLESWWAVSLSDSLLVLPSCLTVTGKHFFILFLWTEFKLQNDCFLTFCITISNCPRSSDSATL